MRYTIGLARKVQPIIMIMITVMEGSRAHTYAQGIPHQGPPSPPAIGAAWRRGWLPHHVSRPQIIKARQVPTNLRFATALGLGCLGMLCFPFPCALAAVFDLRFSRTPPHYSRCGEARQRLLSYESCRREDKRVTWGLTNAFLLSSGRSVLPPLHCCTQWYLMLMVTT